MNTRKKMLELQYLEEQKLQEEIKKIGDAEYYYNMLSVFKSSALICFIASLIMIVIATYAEISLIDTNALLISFVIVTFTILSLISLLMSLFYKNKTLKLLEQHYSRELEAN